MKNLLLVFLLVAEVVLFSAIGGGSFRSAGDILPYVQGLLEQSGHVLFLALGMTVVLMTAGIDLSVGSMVALVACVMASFPEGTSFWWTAVPAGLLLALLLGLTNGALIAFLDIPPIIATLGTMIFYRGLCYVVIGDLEMAPFLSVPGYERFGGYLPILILMALVLGGGGLLFYRSRWRRELLMLGGNRVAARYAGVPVSRRICQVYALVGGLAFLAALLYTARNSSVRANALTGLELKVIVAVVLGGTLVQGGSGSILGSFLGVFVIAVLDEGLRGATQWGNEHLPFSISHLQYVLLGVLLVAGVWLHTQVGKKWG